MNLPLGLFDVFANAIPGAIYLGLLGYLSNRFQWFEVEKLADLETTVAILTFAVCAYVTGNIVGPVASFVTNRVPFWRHTATDAREEFKARNPTLDRQSFLDLDVHTLIAGLRHTSAEASAEIDRFRAQGNMLRNMCPALMAGGMVAMAEASFGNRTTAALVVALVLVPSSMLALRQGRRLLYWAFTATYESAAWLPALRQNE